MPKPFAESEIGGNPDQQVHDLTMYVTKGITGVFVGHVKEIPEVIVQADTEDALDEEATASLDLLITNFPEIHDKLWPHHVSAKGFAGVMKQKMEYRKIELTVPSFG